MRCVFPSQRSECKQDLRICYKVHQCSTVLFGLKLYWRFHLHTSANKGPCRTQLLVRRIQWIVVLNNKPASSHIFRFPLWTSNVCCDISPIFLTTKLFHWDTCETDEKLCQDRKSIWRQQTVQKQFFITRSTLKTGEHFLNNVCFQCYMYKRVGAILHTYKYTNIL